MPKTGLDEIHPFPSKPDRELGKNVLANMVGMSFLDL